MRGCYNPPQEGVTPLHKRGCYTPPQEGVTPLHHCGRRRLVLSFGRQTLASCPGDWSTQPQSSAHSSAVTTNTLHVTVKYQYNKLDMCVEPRQSVWNHTTVCGATPKCVEPHHSLWNHTTVCGATPKCVEPHHSLWNHTKECGTSPQFVEPHQSVWNHIYIYIYIIYRTHFICSRS